MTPRSIVVPLPGNLVSINQTAGWHWSRTHETKTAWLQAGWGHGNNWRRLLLAENETVPFDRPMRISFEFQTEVFRRRDGHNYASTICKWFIDGLVRGGMFLDDDSRHLVVDDPTFIVSKQPLYMTVTIKEIDDASE